jgi:hypothetical protein
MIRTPFLAAVAVALLGGTALAAPADAPPAPLSGSAHAGDTSPNYDDEDSAPPPASQKAPDSRQASRDRDMFCRRDAAARTGYVTPGQAARDEQARGTIGGTLGGAALGAIIGGATHGNAGTGAAIGAGAGLLAGTAVGSANADRAARDVEHAYSDAYYACMNEASDAPPPRDYAYDAPPPPAYPPYPPPPYYGYAPYPYPYYYPPYYGPSIYFGFHGGYGHRGFHRGWHR